MEFGDGQRRRDDNHESSPVIYAAFRRDPHPDTAANLVAGILALLGIGVIFGLCVWLK